MTVKAAFRHVAGCILAVLFQVCPEQRRLLNGFAWQDAAVRMTLSHVACQSGLHSVR